MLSRRDLLRIFGVLPSSGSFGPGLLYSQAALRFHHRQLGRTGRWVVPLGLGGQASLQWPGTGTETDPCDIIVRAVELGVNYLDTANAYGPSQRHYGEAFRRLKLVPDDPNYNPALRERIFLATKTKARLSFDRSAGGAETAIDDLKRSLTTIFGDGNGRIPEGAYLDSVQIHNLQTIEEAGQIYEGFSTRGKGKADRIGALAGLVDFRDGTNLTGLNPDREHWIRHVGITGHRSSAVLMNAIQRDTDQNLDTLLVALNASDRYYCAHQNNVLPLAVARGMGVIAMKVFADGVYYGKPRRFSNAPEDVILTAGAPDGLPCEELVRYAVSLGGVSCAITGIGRIDREKPENDQLAVNLGAALSDLASERERVAIERTVRSSLGADTNYFQDPGRGVVQPSDVRTEKEGDRIRVRWNSALAGPEPIRSYLVVAGERLLASLPFRPQLTLEPYSTTVSAAETKDQPVTVIASIMPPRPVSQEQPRR